MLRAFLRDVLEIPGVWVVTTWDSRGSEELGLESTRLEVKRVTSPADEQRAFVASCAECDASYIIAPELEDELSRRVALAIGANPRHSNLNSTVESIDLCGDKWALYEHLTRQGVPTIPTARVGTGDELPSMGWPRVLKLRMGAGSQNMQVVRSPAAWVSSLKRYDATHRRSEAIAQPWIQGQALSVGVLIDRQGTVHLLPVADQWIDAEQGFAYRGGRIPTCHAVPDLVPLLRRTLSSIPGLRGYVGIDLLLPESPPDRPLIVEINPRLTTSYVGYQRLCRDNLAAVWIGDLPIPTRLCWHPDHVEFDAAGEFR